MKSINKAVAIDRGNAIGRAQTMPSIFLFPCVARVGTLNPDIPATFQILRLGSVYDRNAEAPHPPIYVECGKRWRKCRAVELTELNVFVGPNLLCIMLGSG